MKMQGNNASSAKAKAGTVVHQLIATGLIALGTVTDSAPIAQKAAGPDALPRIGAGESRQLKATEPVVLTKSAFPRCRRITVRFKLRFSGDTEGAGLVFLNTATNIPPGAFPAKFAWQEPNLEKCFAIGFDTSDPPSKNPFNGAGNIYRRSQQQVSLHWNGIEVANVVAPSAFNDGAEHAVTAVVEFTAGGAFVTVRVDAKPAYARHLVIGPTPYAGTVAIGLSPKKNRPDASCRFTWDDMIAENPVETRRKPKRVRVFDGVVLNPKHREHAATVSLPAAGERVQRIILSYTLGAPPSGIDPWDRVLSVYAWDDAGQRFEIVRGVTTFGKPCTLKTDVTDYRSILCGKRKMGIAIGTWVKGWQVDMHLDYYPGSPQWEAFRVTPLWAGDWEYGNPERPLAAHFTPRKIRLDPTTKRAKVRVVVTGHGMHPNTANAGEFFPAWRTLIVDGHSFKNKLWRTDCWLNPCRPQGGTWKYDRAGWCPGALVRPWDTDITDILPPNRLVTIEYRPQEYINRNAGKSRASHLVEAQLIEYRAPADKTR